MTNSTDSATGFAWSSDQQATNGLTKREYFAAMRRTQPNEIGLHAAQVIMGTKPPENSIENLKWWIEVEEKYAVMKADALIKALNENPDGSTHNS